MKRVQIRLNVIVDVEEGEDEGALARSMCEFMESHWERVHAVEQGRIDIAHGSHEAPQTPSDQGI